MQPIVKPNKRQHEAYAKLQDKTTKYVFMGGAAGGGKTWLIAEWLMTNCYFFPNSRWFMAREELKRLRETTLQTFFKVLRYYNIPQGDFRYNGQDSFIEHKNGSRISLLDLKYLPSDPLFERFGSLEYTGGAMDECGETHFGAFDTLKTRIGRWNNDLYGLTPAKMLLTGNPKKNWTYHTFYKPNRDNTLPKDHAFIVSFATENEYIDSGYIENLHGIKDKVLKERLLYGNWEYDNDPSALIEYDKIVDVFSNTFVEKNMFYITADVARFGSDKAVILLWNGLRVEKIITFDVSKTTELEDKISTLATEYSVPRSRIMVDEDGVGGGVLDHLKCKGFVNQSKPRNKTYANLKSECSFKLAEMVNKSEVYISANGERDTIIEELEQLKRDNVDKDGKLTIIKKDKVKDLIGRSPDYSDALMMRMWFEVNNKQRIYRG